MEVKSFVGIGEDVETLRGAKITHAVSESIPEQVSTALMAIGAFDLVVIKNANDGNQPTYTC